MVDVAALDRSGGGDVTSVLADLAATLRTQPDTQPDTERISEPATEEQP
jgi:hypothetical protein